MELDHLDYKIEGQDYRLVYWQKGRKDADRVVVCVHGLLRHSRDFDELAERLSANALVICPDLPGRGLSDWFDDPKLYRADIYGEILLALLNKFPTRAIDWIGTSLGGLVGMGLASLEGSRISRLVLNDIGPELPGVALQRIANYIEDPRFESQDQVTEYLKLRYLSYAGLSQAQWLRLSRYGCRATANNKLALHYDPAIAESARASAQETIEIWPIWHQIAQPVLLFHGLDSDLLTADIVQRMKASHTDIEVVALDGVAHAPSLMEDTHIDAITDWFSRH